MKLIIDEYTLPDQFKSTRVLHTAIHKEKPATPNYQKSDMEEIESVPENTDSDYSTSSASTLDKVPSHSLSRTITANRPAQRQGMAMTASQKPPR